MLKASLVDPMVNSSFHLLQLDQMNVRNSRGLCCNLSPCSQREAYTELCQSSKMEDFVKMVNSFKSLTISQNIPS